MPKSFHGPALQRLLLVEMSPQNAHIKNMFLRIKGE